MADYPAVVTAAKTAGLASWLPLLVQLDLTSPAAVLKGASQLSAHGMSEADLKSLLVPLKSGSLKQKANPARSDIPVVQPSSGGSIELALQAAESNNRDKALARLDEDVYARSNGGPQVSRMKTWRRLATAWNLPPMPITVELLRAIGASFKAGGYRSAHLYFGTANHGSFSQDLEVAMQDVIRSIERGQGPSKLKDSFSLFQLLKIDMAAYDAAFAVKFIMVILGCYFLTREIELAATVRKHLHLDTHRMVVTWTLPASKTDTKGGFITRAHKCMCQTVASRLCPYHAAYELQKLTYDAADPDGEGPLFSTNMEVMTKHETIANIRAVLQAAGIETTRQGADGLMERYHGHCLRVSGAQFLTQMKFSAQLVMLTGRWGSQAILRYIQDSPLTALIDDEHPQTVPAPATPGSAEVTGPSFKKLKSAHEGTAQKVEAMEDRLSKLVAEVANINQTPKYIVGKKTHLPDHREKLMTPREWVSKCGWAYGMSRFRRTDEPGDWCRKCFNLSEATEAEAEDEDSSSSDSSSS